MSVDMEGAHEGKMGGFGLKQEPWGPFLSPSKEEQRLACGVRQAEESLHNKTDRRGGAADSRRP